ncbi:MAG: substrate-binding domain-containing protein [Acidimicrobiales bacterium]|jgi:ribose transport system substrate-binding protein
MRYSVGALVVATAIGMCVIPVMQSGATTKSKASVLKLSKAAGATSCGQIPFKLPPDPSGVLKTLPQSVLENYNNYLPMSAITSPWKNFSTKMPKGGYVIGYSNSYSGNYWRADLLAELNHDFAIAKKAGLVSKFIVSDSNLNNAVQIQQVRSMIEQHVNLILAIPNSSTAMNGVFQQAYKAGIPVVTIDAPTTSAYTVDVDNQNWMTGALAASGLVKEMGYKGNVLMVDGLAGSPGSVLLHNGAASVFADCPNVKVVASVPGNWDEADSKSATLEALSTHPETINGVYAQGGEILGAVEAFQQTGRAIPALADGNPDEATLGWVRENINTVKYCAAINPPRSAGNASWRVALRILMGQGIKIKGVPALPPLTSTKSALLNWIPKSWTPQSTGQAPAPPGAQWIPDSMLNDLFVHPKALPVNFPVTS